MGTLKTKRWLIKKTKTDAIINNLPKSIAKWLR